MRTIEEIKEELLENEESWMIEAVDQMEWLIEHTLEDRDQVLDNFIRNYKTTNAHSIIQFGDYESSEANYIIQKLGTEATIELILNHLNITQDHDIYHEHWNDIASADWSEYEVQIDIDEDHEHYQLFKDANETSFFGNVSLGMIRYKLDTESFEKELLQSHGIDINCFSDEDLVEAQA